MRKFPVNFVTRFNQIESKLSCYLSEPFSFYIKFGSDQNQGTSHMLSFVLYQPYMPLFWAKLKKAASLVIFYVFTFTCCSCNCKTIGLFPALASFVFFSVIV